ncbi:MAG: iron-sulfur cluster repair di-iron protein [Opitutaceae bacterium]|nr:iron-sulfur cluster repair di-iron protein [Opitutaceae bacterium]
MHTVGPIHPDQTVGDIVVAAPGLARIFEQLGIDYCCGGQRPLAEAALEKGFDPKTVAALLAAAVSARDAAGPDTHDVATMTLSELTAHIEQTHHRYLKQELPRLIEMAERVAQKHAERDPRLTALQATVHRLAGEMTDHMQKEESVLFPLVRAIEQQAGSDRTAADFLIHPIRQMEAEHESAGLATAQLHELTDGFRPDAAACNTHRALLNGLAEFEADLHRHVHKENNVLFPRALALAARHRPA